MSTPGPVALIPWGDVMEDYLEPLGLEFADFARMTGGALYGYVEALAAAGQSSMVICLSTRFERPVSHVHVPSGVRVMGIPMTSLYRRLHGRGGSQAGGASGGPGAGRAGPALLKSSWRTAAPYLQTPLVELARLLRKERCSAVMCQEYEYARFDALVALGRFIGIPVFGYFQGGAPRRSALEPAVRPMAMRLAAGVVVAPASEAERVQTRYRVRRIARIPNPLGTSDLVPADRTEARARYGIPQDHFVIAWHGRVYMELKGLDVLLDAWRAVAGAGAGQPVHLLLVGTGPDAAALRARLAGYPATEVTWIAAHVMDRAEICAMLSAADVYVLSSRREGFPMAPLEAMYCGVPVVATDVSGIREILPDGEQSGGIVVPIGDVDAMADALARLLTDPPLRATMARAARARAEDGFSPAGIGEQLVSLLQSRSTAP